MRLGGPLFEKFDGPDGWVRAVKNAGYRAAFCPLPPDTPEDTVSAYADAARKADIVIAEVGAWSNPFSPDAETASAALQKCKDSLALADRIGARCCVNISGSRGEKWAGPSAEDLTPDTFNRIVTMVREIIDDVQPTRSFYALETMPWMIPDSVESYVELMRAIDRPGFAVHFDPVNIINCPSRYFRNAAVIRDFVAKLGPHIKSCHAKDTLLAGKLTVHLDEVRPGTGTLDYATLLRELSVLDADMPVMLEHLPNADEYALAAEYVRRVAREEGVTV